MCHVTFFKPNEAAEIIDTVWKFYAEVLLRILKDKPSLRYNRNTFD